MGKADAGRGRSPPTTAAALRGGERGALPASVANALWGRSARGGADLRVGYGMVDG
jgi:hypothetical protein